MIKTFADGENHVRLYGIGKLIAEREIIMKNIYALVAILVCVLLTGCGISGGMDKLNRLTAKETYQYPVKGLPLKRVEKSPFSSKKVAILPFKNRMIGYYDSANQGTFYFAFIPLFPFGYVIMDPDKRLTSKLTDSALTSLKESNVFQEIFRSGQNQPDLLLKGEVLSSNKEGLLWSYGLSSIGIFLGGILGAPVFSIDEELALRFYLTNANTKKLIWTKAYHGDEAKMVIALYYYVAYEQALNNGKAYVMQNIMNDLILDLGSLDY